MAIKHFKVENKFSDARGFLIPLVDEDNFKVKNVLHIFCKAGTIRGNHYHKKESYWDYCLSGKFRYYEKDIKEESAKLEQAIIEEGEMVYCPNNTAHAMEFLQDSIVICLSSRSRKKKIYDADVVYKKIV